jgi:hypothetical protein
MTIPTAEVDRTSSSSVTAMAYLNMARQYREAGDEVFAVSEQRPLVHGHRQLSDPISFLYFHAVELGLKAFLRQHNEDIPTSGRASHNISKLYERCLGLGLTIGPDDRLTVGNIVYLLSRGNTRDGFRYFTPGTSVTADLEWIREVVGTLIDWLANRIVADGFPQRLAKMTMVVGKPVSKGST